MADESAAAPPERELAAPSKAASPSSKLAKMAAFSLCLAGFVLAVPFILIVLTRTTPPPPVRTYHIAVEEVAWRYAPSVRQRRAPQTRAPPCRRATRARARARARAPAFTPPPPPHPQPPQGADNCTGVPAALSEHAATFILADPAAGLIGDTYWRRRYVSYEPDGAFATPRADDAWSHAGVQGPSLRVAVGDVLRVRLLNKARFPASLCVPRAAAPRPPAARAAQP